MAAVRTLQSASIGQVVARALANGLDNVTNNSKYYVRKNHKGQEGTRNDT